MHVEPCLHPLSITIPVHMTASYVSTCNLSEGLLCPEGMLGPLTGHLGALGSSKVS